MLDRLYAEFDNLCGKYGLFKVSFDHLCGKYGAVQGESFDNLCVKYGLFKVRVLTTCAGSTGCPR